MLKVHFRCLRLAKSERQRLRRRLDPSPHPASALGLAGVGGRRGCRGTYRNLRLNLCKSKVDWFREQRRPHPGSDPAPRKSEALQRRGEFLRGGCAGVAPALRVFRPSLPTALANPGSAWWGGGVHGCASGAETWVGPAPSAAPARHLLIFAPTPTPGRNTPWRWP